MDHANIIISVIVVLCIAAGVTAYGLTNPDNAFSDLAGFTPSADSLASAGNGLGNNTTQATDSNSAGSSSNGQPSSNSGSNVANSGSGSNGGSSGTSSSGSSNGGSSSGSSNGGHSTSTNGNSGSGTTSGSGSSGSGSDSGSGTTSHINSTKAIEIANEHVEEEGCSVSAAVWKDNDWYCYVHDKDGNTVDCIIIDGNGNVIGEG
ncbi:MAG: endoglucanase [Methanobacteriaceae archaeon]|nr:endoglucanase [Methanobacteriaceae archaeon]MDD4593698.1 endoglucanase [Methanobacteriaceae archaeon]